VYVGSKALGGSKALSAAERSLIAHLQKRGGGDGGHVTTGWGLLLLHMSVALRL